MAVPLLVAARAAFVVAKEVYRHRDLAGAVSGEEDPRAIIMSARDPNVPARRLLSSVLRRRQQRLL
jgi:hypothetical protein